MLEPIEYQWSHDLGHLYMTAGRLEESRDNFEYALSLRPASVPTLVWLGQVYMSMNEIEAAESRFKQALELAENSAPAIAALGEIALSRQDYQAAVDYLTAALELAPAANRLHYPLAMAYRGLGDMDSARAHLAQRGTVGLRPEDPLIDELTGAMEGEMIHLLRGKMAFAAGRYTDAAEEFRRAAEAAPNSARAKVNLGSALGMLGDVDAAIEQYAAALSVAPENTNAHFNLGYLHAQRGDYEKAVEHLGAVVRIEPRDSEAHFQLAEVLRRSGRLDEALTQYSLVVDLAPLDERARLGEAEIDVQRGRYQEAVERLDNALAMIPSSALIAHALARLLAACPNLSVRDGARALDLAQRVFEADPRVVHAETVAMALAEVGRCEEAVAWQRTAVESAEAAGEVEWTMDLRAALAHYERGAPCRFPAEPSWKR
jgi:tetratricopeptide (TPR) repeat protein